MAERSTLIPGAFYWVVPALDPDADFAWERCTQPARFVGFDAEGREMWNWLGIEGVATWPAIWIGPQLISPMADELERRSLGEMSFAEWCKR